MPTYAAITHLSTVSISFSNDIMRFQLGMTPRSIFHFFSPPNNPIQSWKALGRQTSNQRLQNQVCGEVVEVRSSSILCSATAFESRGDRAADPEWRKRRLRRLPLHNRCRMGIAGRASDGIQSELDEHRQKELKSQDRRGLSRESSRQLQLRTIHRIMPRLEVFCGVLGYHYVHGSELRRRDLSWSSVRNFASPRWARAFRSTKTS